ncbi:MAG TPA: hypothetical protein DCR91_10445 [Eubacterium sp.]|nr:hypothetical protein [Eubacterium sp.]HAZ85501.1 hypothetical protein [Eubacterium sp.]
MGYNTVSIGNQGFDDIRENKYFYIDKTGLIKEWWSSGDAVTLITRPRRFGKTLNMSMLNCFFSNQYANRGDLFEGLSVWEDEKYRQLQGTYPVIFLSFADVKQNDLQGALWKIKKIIFNIYQQYAWLGSWEGLMAVEREQFVGITPDMEDTAAQSAIQDLCSYLSRYYKKKVIVILDEYDTPMQEAYIHGYWDKFTAFMRSLFNATFKTNPYLERAVMTGITRVSKESIFSDLNNLAVVTTTSDRYSTAFGFTQEEVFKSLDDMGLGERRDDVKRWYDGFVFGEHRDIYNPWSITNFLKEKKLRPYWASTSSNGLVSRLIQTAPPDIKQMMEDLISGREIVVNFDEQIVFSQLGKNKNAIWSLLMASGYLKPDKVEYKGELLEPWYHLSITNLETVSMFSNMFKGWFDSDSSNYSEFVQALLKGRLREMNIYMNDIALSTFSYFDVGTQPSERTQPERFFHGFVLGLLVELRDIYEIKSNRESGYGRYDVMLVPKSDDRKYNAIILEFKVYDSYDESTLEDTAQSALRQIEEKNYDAELIARGIEKDRIRHYGFAFEGKKVLIAE